MNRKVNIHVIVNEYLPKILTIPMNMNFGFPNSSWTEYSKNLKKRNSSWIDSNQFEFNSNKRNSGGSATHNIYYFIYYAIQPKDINILSIYQ